MKYESVRNKLETVIFRKNIGYGEVGYIEKTLSGHGDITKATIRFAVGEAGTLHLRPTVIIPNDIEIDLFSYADGGLTYVNGDGEVIESDLKLEIERKSRLRVYYENTNTDALSPDSVLNVDIGVNYYQVVEAENVIGVRSSKWGF